MVELTFYLYKITSLSAIITIFSKIWLLYALNISNPLDILSLLYEFSFGKYNIAVLASLISECCNAFFIVFFSVS